MDANYYSRYEPLFGAWHITKQLGEGSGGSVFVIERQEWGQTYRAALKAITVPGSRSEIKNAMSDGMTKEDIAAYYKAVAEEIIREFVLMSKLKGNSHIVSYEDHMIIEHEDGIGRDILIRMELLTPLVEITSRSQLSEKEVIRLGAELCRALELCERHSIIHRDLKPENIFVSANGDYKIGDFGTARTVAKTKKALSRKGTDLYIAPEIYRGEAYDASVDIYSLGLVMYKLLNQNRLPFMPEYPMSVMPVDREEALHKRLTGRRIPEPQNGSSELKRIVLKACAYRPENRYRSAAEMRKELDMFVYGTAGIGSRKPEHENPHRRHTIPPGAAAAIRIILAIGGGCCAGRIVGARIGRLIHKTDR